LCLGGLPATIAVAADERCLLAAPAAAAPASAGHGPRLFLLCASGLYCARLMGWQERLSTLQGIGKWRLALHVALASHRSQAARHGRPPGDPAAPPHQQQLEQWMLNLAAGHVQATLAECAHPMATAAAAAAVAADDDDAAAAGDGGGGGGPDSPSTAIAAALEPEAPAAVADAARVAICACLLLRSPETLFDRIFALFRRYRQTAAFLDALEPYILADALPSLAPEARALATLCRWPPPLATAASGRRRCCCCWPLIPTTLLLILSFVPCRRCPNNQKPCLSRARAREQVVQALVERFASLGQPERVERCVLHLDLMSLDLDQVRARAPALGCFFAGLRVWAGGDRCSGRRALSLNRINAPFPPGALGAGHPPVRAPPAAVRPGLHLHPNPRLPEADGRPPACRGGRQRRR
jgi:hypothetical protein